MGKTLIAFTGFMGAGKSAVARALAQRHGWMPLDLDGYLEAKHGEPIAAMFAQGEPAFRARETAALRELLDSHADDSLPVVIALGGGTWIQEENRALLLQRGARVIFLDTPLAEVLRRCEPAFDERPLLAGDVEALYRARQPVYALAAHRLDCAGKPLVEVVEQVERLLHEAGVIEPE